MLLLLLYILNKWKHIILKHFTYYNIIVLIKVFRSVVTQIQIYKYISIFRIPQLSI